MLRQYEKLVYFTEDQWYETIRLVFPKEMQHIDEDRLETLFERVLEHRSSEEQAIILESLGKIAKDIGKFTVNNAATLGMLTGSVAGGIIGGPAGVATGAQVGGQIGSLVQPNKPPKTPNSQSPIPARSPLKPVALTNNPSYLIAIIQTIVQQILQQMIAQKNGTHLKPANSRGQAEIIEIFGNAIAVFGEEQAIEFSRFQVHLESNRMLRSPKERADYLLETLFP